jgi:Spy/CpxP family protein refolding chaperone
MKNFKQITALIAATSILTLATIAHAGEPEEDGVPGFHQHFKTDDGLDGEGWKHGPRGLGAREHGRLPFQLLDLTDAQKQTLEAARAAREPAMKEAHKKLRAARVALDNAGDQNADDATLNKLSADLASIIAQQEVTRIKIHRDFLNILTPEQKEKLAAFEAEHKRPRWQDRQKTSSSKATTKN